MVAQDFVEPWTISKREAVPPPPVAPATPAVVSPSCCGAKLLAALPIPAAACCKGLVLSVDVYWEKCKRHAEQLEPMLDENYCFSAVQSASTCVLKSQEDRQLAGYADEMQVADADDEAALNKKAGELFLLFS